MSLVYVNTAASVSEPVARKEYDRFIQLYRADRFGKHKLTDNPGQADLIIFVEKEDIIGPLLTRSFFHNLARANRTKCFMVNPRYKNLPLMPGIYASSPLYPKK